MAIEPKVRPSMSIQDLQVITQALEFKISAHIKAGDYNNPAVLRMSRIKAYCEGFCTAGETPEQLVARYLAQQNITNISPMVAKTLTNDIEISDATGVQQTDLTDEQKYDLLKLRPASTYTDEENAFFLNTGTMIEIKRMSNKPVSDKDL
jgi:hypothetical protein